jgi:hypothetical protein
MVGQAGFLGVGRWDFSRALSTLWRPCPKTHRAVCHRTTQHAHNTCGSGLGSESGESSSDRISALRSVLPRQVTSAQRPTRSCPIASQTADTPASASQAESPSPVSQITLNRKSPSADSSGGVLTTVPSPQQLWTSPRGERTRSGGSGIPEGSRRDEDSLGQTA